MFDYELDVKILMCSVFSMFLLSCRESGCGGGSSEATQAVLPDGNFSYADGTTYGIHCDISNTGIEYIITHYSINGGVYAQEAETISYSGNELTFTVTFTVNSSIPSRCLSGGGTLKFSNTETTITLEAQGLRI